MINSDTDLRYNKLFFLHIPKTAGTSVNEMLANGFRSSNVRFHIENDRNEHYRNIDSGKYDMLSGHVRVDEMLHFFPGDNYLRVTLLRDPFEQLLSHINWVKYISENPNSSFFNGHPEFIKQFSLLLRGLDFDDESAVEKFFGNLPDIGISLFNNCQTRYLFRGNPAPMLLETDALKAIESLNLFHVVGVVEQLDQFVREVFDKMGWKLKPKILQKNVQKHNYSIHDKNDRLKELLFPLYCADMVVYEYAKANIH